MTLKDDFLQAIVNGDLGEQNAYGVEVSLREFRQYFKHIESAYLTSFLPASVIEQGQNSISRTRFLFRVKKGIYRVHPQAIDEYCHQYGLSSLPLWKQKQVHRNIDFLSLKF